MLSFCELIKVQYAGLCLWSFQPIGFICVLSIIASNVAGHTKKITTSTINLIAYCIGNLVGPPTFIDNQAPGYVSAKIAIVVCCSLAIVALIAIWFLYVSRNRNLEWCLTSNIHGIEFADLTDKQNPNFKYSMITQINLKCYIFVRQCNAKLFEQRKIFGCCWNTSMLHSFLQPEEIRQFLIQANLLLNSINVGINITQAKLLVPNGEIRKHLFWNFTTHH